MLICIGLSLIGYGFLVWSEGWLVALCIYIIQWASNMENTIKYVEKQNTLLDLFKGR